VTARLSAVVARPDHAVTRLHRLVRQREALTPAFHDAWGRIAGRADAAALERWAEAVIELAFVNAGPSCLLAFWRASGEARGGIGLTDLAAVGHAAAEICRHAGAAATRACLDTVPAIAPRLAAGGLVAWWGVLTRLARAAPEAIVAVAAKTEAILSGCGDPAGFEAFVLAGLKAGGDSRAKRLAFFSLEDPEARRVLDRLAAGLAFGDVERPLRMMLTALWGEVPELRAVAAAPGRPLPRRTNLAGRIVRIPEVFRGVPAATAPALFRASAAHAVAHLRLSDPRFAAAGLKPLQIALVGLVEDARVEALAMARFPGLARLWRPFHVATPDGMATAAGLMARLARALIDPAYEDGDGFVAKGRALFADETAAGHLDDPAMSRRIGGLLGNDLGQARLQFDARGHVVEPVYRDDNLGLWDFGETPDADPEEIEVPVDAVRLRREEDPADADRERDEAEQRPGAAGRAKGVAAERGAILATYPEWDREAAVERPDWTTVRAAEPQPGDPRAIDRLLDREPALRARIARLVRAARIGRRSRLKRQPEGADLDLDAVLDAGIALRLGDLPDPRLFRSHGRPARDLAATVLVDISESTADRVGGSGDAGESGDAGGLASTGGRGGQGSPAGFGSGPAAGLATVLDVERLAVAHLAEAMAALGDRFAVSAFASTGRDDVRHLAVKGFAEPYDAAAKARLAGLRPGLSTRLGAALRHAGAELAAVRAERRLLLVLTDGEPSDIDVADPLDLVADARRAVLGLKAAGIDVFGVTLGPPAAGAAVFGRPNHLALARVEDLPGRLSELYFRLARR